MSIRIGLYDFFAYALPGIFYLIIVGFWLASFGLVMIDLKTLESLSASSLLVIVGAGYIVGQLIDPIAYRWMRIFQSRNRDAVKIAFNEFHSQHPWLVLNFKPADWGILLRAIKSKSLDAAMDVEQHNVAAIMLRNISLGLVLVSGSYLVYFLVVNTNIWNLLLSVAFFALSIAAMRRSRLRRHWFYTAVFEAFSAYYLLQDKLSGEKPAVASNTHPIDTAISTPSSETKPNHIE